MKCKLHKVFLRLHCLEWWLWLVKGLLFLSSLLVFYWSTELYSSCTSFTCSMLPNISYCFEDVFLVWNFGDLLVLLLDIFYVSSSEGPYTLLFALSFAASSTFWMVFLILVFTSSTASFLFLYIIVIKNLSALLFLSLIINLAISIHFDWIF